MHRSSFYATTTSISIEFWSYPEIIPVSAKISRNYIYESKVCFVRHSIYWLHWTTLFARVSTFACTRRTVMYENAINEALPSDIGDSFILYSVDYNARDKTSINVFIKIMITSWILTRNFKIKTRTLNPRANTFVTINLTICRMHTRGNSFIPIGFICVAQNTSNLSVLGNQLPRFGHFSHFKDISFLIISLGILITGTHGETRASLIYAITRAIHFQLDALSSPANLCAHIMRKVCVNA